MELLDLPNNTSFSSADIYVRSLQEFNEVTCGGSVASWVLTAW